MKQVQIVMPQMGQSVAEGTITAWKKRVGEPIKLDEVLLEVETDKTTVDVESPSSGTLVSCLKQEGDIAAAGEIIGMIESDMEDEEALPVSEAGSQKPHAGGDQHEQVVVSTQQDIRINYNRAALPEINRDRFSPYVMRLAMFNDVSMAELESIKGTGRNGRVTKNDLLNYLSRRPVGATTLEAMTGKDTVSEADLAKLGDVMPMTSVRRTIADHMVQSIHTSAHVTMVHAVDLTHVVNLRERIKDDFQKKYNAKLTYTGVMLFVTSRVLNEFPSINASVYGTNLILRKEVHIGCAVALSDESLVVPVVKNADQKSFPEVAQDLDRLIKLARNKALKRDDVDSGTFTISNFGAFGSIIGTPIINQPQVAILGMGAVVKTPVVINNEIGIRDQLYLSFSFDHRVIDGAMGGRFLNAIQKATEALTEDDLNLNSL